MAQPVRHLRALPAEPSVARRRYRFRRRHTPHFYLVTVSLALAVGVVAADITGVLVAGVLTGEIAFAILSIAWVSVLVSYFWGFFMLMNGNLPVHRLKVFVPHAIVGTLSPLIYMLNISLALDAVGRGPVGIFSLFCACASLAVIILQFTMGRRVVKVEPLRVVRPRDV